MRICGLGFIQIHNYPSQLKREAPNKIMSYYDNVSLLIDENVIYTFNEGNNDSLLGIYSP